MGAFLTRDPRRIMALLCRVQAMPGTRVIELESILEGSPALRDALPVPHPGKRHRK
jgi:hypothetical protein